MISIKSAKDLEKMRRAGAITAGSLIAAGNAIHAGMSTKELDKVVHNYITSHGAKPSFLGYAGYPGSACISVNDTVIHGIPSPNIKLHEGDIVSVDVGAYIDGFHGRASGTKTKRLRWKRPVPFVPKREKILSIFSARSGLAVLKKSGSTLLSCAA